MILEESSSHLPDPRTTWCSSGCRFRECELLGWLLDGFPIYSHCGGLRSCYFLKKIGASGSAGSHLPDGNRAASNLPGQDTTDYQYVLAGTPGGAHCDLDAANGYNFTGKGLLDGASGRPISGYGYVASEDYPWVMPKFAGRALVTSWLPV